MQVSGEYTYQRINYHIRMWISMLLNRKYSCRQIAKEIGKHHSSISREIKRNCIIRYGKKYYDAFRANEKALERLKKIREPKISKSKRLLNFIHSMLKKKYGPDEISGTLKRFKSKLYVCHETIYRYIYKYKREWINLLARGHRKRFKRLGKYKNRRKIRIPERISIDDRPEHIAKRNVFGHFESDLIESRMSKAAILVLIERKTRFIRLVKLRCKKAINIKNGIIRVLSNICIKIKSITYDNGLENVLHVKVNNALGCKSYFCNPYHSWEKGSVENVIGIVRRFVPKKTNLSKLTQNGLNRIEKIVNNKPRKLFNYYSALELFRKEVVH